MDRRAALRNMSLSLGYVVATPTILSVLQSCTTDPKLWSPMFFTKTEGYMITQLSDIILPKTDIAGALDVNVPEFMDKMFHDILGDDQKQTMKEGALAFENAFKKVYNKDASQGSKAEYEKLLATYYNISEEKQKKISAMLRDDKSKLTSEKINTFLIYKFLGETKNYTLRGYYTSELVGETILNYDPIPGVYEPCIPLEDVGNSWSL